MAQINANLSNYEAEEKLPPLAPGWYDVEVTDSEIKQSQKSGNTYIQWEFQVVGKPNKVWMTTVLGNDVAMKILKTMATCLGHRNPNYIADTEELHGRRCQAKLRIITDENGDYDPKNEIKGFKPLEKKAAPAAPPIQQDFRPKQAAPPFVQPDPNIPPNVPPAHVIAGSSVSQPANNAAPAKMPWEPA